MFEMFETPGKFELEGRGRKGRGKFETFVIEERNIREGKRLKCLKNLEWRRGIEGRGNVCNA